MRENRESSDPSWPLALARVVDAVCERFETACQQGQRPRLEDFLGEQPEPERSLLLRELLTLELVYSCRLGETPRPEEYCRRFPGHVELIHSVFQKANVAQTVITPVLQDPPGPRAHLPGGPPATSAGGVVTAERYLLEEELGRGGMGQVYRGRDRLLDRPVALKVLHGLHRGEPDFERRFREEAQRTGQLQHPGIPPVHEVGVLPDGRPFFALKLIQGRTLAELLRERSGVGDDLPRWLGVFEQVCQTLGYSHSQGVIHRDLKPANVMVGAFGEVQVMDWGLARVLAGNRTEQSAGKPAGTEAPWEQITQAGEVLGTPSYMAPEQARGEWDRVDQRADVFGLGAILYEILTGRTPFTGRSLEALEKAQAANLAEAWAELDGCRADAELVALVRRCLAAEPGDRPRDAAEVAEGVTAYLRGVAERLRQAELGQAAAQARAREEVKRRRLALVLAGVLLLVGLAGGASGWWWWQGRAEVVRQVESALTDADRARQDERWPEVRAALERALGHLGSGGPAELRQRVEQGKRDADMVAALEKVRLRQAEAGGGDFDWRSADAGYVEAFRTYGIDVDGGDPEEAAVRVRGSAIRDHLLAALDDWWVSRGGKGDRPGAERVWVVADRTAEDNWRARLRAAAVAKDLGPLKGLTDQAAGQPPAMQAALARALQNRGAAAEAERVLRRGLAARPDDFWLAFLLGGLLFDRQRWGEAEGYYRLALGLRPNSPEVWSHHGMNLWQQRKVDEAVACLRRAVELDLSGPRYHNNLGLVLGQLGNLDEAVASLRRAIELNPNHVQAHNNLGRALNQQGKLDEAEACLRRAVQLDPNDAGIHCTLGQILVQQGRFQEGLAASERGHQLGSKTPGWRYPSAQQVWECRWLMELEERLPGLLAGTDRPVNDGERMGLARMCMLKQRFAAAAGLYAEAFATRPGLAADSRAGHRYNAACSAARAGCGQGVDATGLPEADRLRWRRQALTWLRADLGALTELLDKGPPPARQVVQQQLRHRRHNPDLAGLRDPEALNRLPEAERQACGRLWADVAELLKRAQQKTER
jgi:serine/threonine-protein kinase